jgi:transcriptional regulator with XRE-family HTH domain
MVRRSSAWERLRAIEASPELEEIRRKEFPFRNVAYAVLGLRGRLGLTQQQLAERVGTTQSVIARLESGKHPVEVRLLSRVADATGEPLIVPFGHRELYERTDQSELHRVAEQPTEYAATDSGDPLLDSSNNANTPGDFATSAEIAQRMEREPLTPRRRVALSLTAMNRADYPAAVAYAAAALEGELPPASRDVATLMHGRALLNLGKPRKALQALPEPGPDAPHAWLIAAARADAYVELGIDRRAMDEVRKAVALAPGIPEARYHAARTAWHTNRIWEALDHIVVYRAAEPDNPDGVTLHGSILGYIGSEHDDEDALRRALALFKKLVATKRCEAIRLYAVTAAHLGEWKVALRAASRFLAHRGDGGAGQCEHTRAGLDHRHYVLEHFLPDVFEALEDRSVEEREAAVAEAEARFGTSPVIATQRALLRARAGDLVGTLGALDLSRETVAQATPMQQAIVAGAMYYRHDYAGAYDILRRIESDLSRPEGLLQLAECAAAASEVEEARRVLGILAEGEDSVAWVARVASATLRLQRAISRVMEPVADYARWNSLTNQAMPMTPRHSPWEGDHHPTTPMLEALASRTPLN